MKNIGLLAVLISCLHWQLQGMADASDVTPAVVAALEKLDATNLDNDWYFTMKVVEEDELQEISSDPRRGLYEKRQLLSVNGVAPDKQRQDEFRDAEVERIDALDPDASGYRHMVDLRTLQLLEKSDDYAKLSFIPNMKALGEARDQIRGTLMLNMDTQQIEKIEIINTEELSPAFSVTLDSYRLTLEFESEQEENLIIKLESHVVGKAGFLKSFDALVVVAFGDYKRADPDLFVPGMPANQ